MDGLLEKLKGKLLKTRQGFVHKIDQFFSQFAKVDEEMFENLEELLIQADIGVTTAIELTDKLRQAVKEQKITEPAELTEQMQTLVLEFLGSKEELKTGEAESLTVYLIVGVNGVGKTTTIGKLAYNLTQEGQKVVVAAADTFRAAAIDQLEIWAKRAKADLVKHSEGADPAAVVYDALQAARARKADVLIIDTAGRLHNKVNLMNELNKIKRVAAREIPQAPHEVLLVLDATTGQNAIQQVKVFTESAEVSGVVLTKMDGTAKGGVIVGLRRETGIPVKLIGVGEGIDDLQPFDPEEFTRALFERA